MPNERTPKKPRQQYRLRTRLIHGSFPTGRWDCDRHVVPPQCSLATYRLSPVHRGAQGFVEFATPESRSAPIYIYDRLDEPSRGMLEENLAAAEGGEVAVTFADGNGLGQRSAGSADGYGRPDRGAPDVVWLHAQPAMELAAALGKSGDEELPGGLSAGEFVPDHAGGEPGADQDADREPIFHDACFASRRRKDSQRIATRRHPVVAGSGGLARHYCRIADLEDVLEAV
jgi:hypothetical protein